MWITFQPLKKSVDIVDNFVYKSIFKQIRLKFLWINIV